MDRERALIERLSAQIVEWEAQMDRLQFEAENSSKQLKSAHLEQLEALRQKRDEAQAQLQQIGTGKSDVGKDLAEGTRELGHDVKSGLRRAILKVK